ncbi:MAG: hypothetical protein IPJ55_15835 [Chloracidobacterium sp.]|nr:hypothetical protein [Chloracidobacterium sp.]
MDAMELMIIPITLGPGKRLFQDGNIPAAFKVTSSQVAPKGIIICITYEGDGDVKTGAPQTEEDDPIKAIRVMARCNMEKMFAA